MYCLSGILPSEHFRCWQTFALACKYFCQPINSQTDLEIADGMLIKFCKSVESLYGNLSITPNMHMHGHLKEVILYHGPITGFWCFSFERFNGILGSTTTNKRSVELQLMRRLILSRYFGQVSMPRDFQDEFASLCTPEINNTEQDEPANNEWHTSFLFQRICTSIPLQNIDWKNSCLIKLPSFHKISAMDSDDLQLLMQVYKIMFPEKDIELANLAENIHKYGSVTIGHVHYGSRLEPRGMRSSNILASWPKGDGNVNQETFCLNPGTVNFYFTHSLRIGRSYHCFHFACVRWYRPDERPNAIGNPVSVWRKNYQEGGPSSFIPVQRIFSRFAYAEIKSDDDVKLVVSPIARKTYL